MNSNTLSHKKAFGISSFYIKLIAAILMTLDHIALLFLPRGSETINLDYYILRAVGKMAFPVYAMLAVEGAYHSKNILLYLIRLGGLALLLDVFGFSFGAILSLPVSQNPLIGNAFTDMFMGVLMITLLRRKDSYSVFALLPIAYEIFSDYPINNAWGTLFKSDWGSFSIILFGFLFLLRELTDLYLNKRALREGLEEDSYVSDNPIRYYKWSYSLALIITEVIFYFIYRMNYQAFIIPEEFVPIGTYSTLAFVFYLLYNGEKGYKSKWIQYSFYAYYPLHLMVLGIMSMSFGILSTML